MRVTPSEFEQGYRIFQSKDPRDAMYKTATFVVEHFWGRPREMADGIGVILLTWNQALYRYGTFDFEILEEVLRNNMDVFEEFRIRNILTLTDADKPIIEQLFQLLLDALRIKEGKRKDYKSPVAVAKALHLLAPAFFPLWDDKISNGYNCRYSHHPAQQYLSFAFKMQTLAGELHHLVPPDCGRTFLKLIDEYNFAKYTRNWI